MASFTDLPPQFTPYTPQLPVEAMVKVGMQKQALYDQGVQKIQAQIEQVAGMDVLRDVDKNYLQSKLNELGNNLKTFAASDFSNYQLVNSVGGMTKQIVKDSTIQAAVSSTANHRKQRAQMDADKKKGTLTPDNELFYNEQLNKYLKSTDIKDEEGNPVTFSGQYIPNFDIWKFAKETFDAVKPDGMSFDQIWQLGADGKPSHDAKGNLIYSPTMTRMEKEGIFPEKVKATLTQIFSDPRVSQQLQITGQYNYRGESANNLANRILGQKQELLSSYGDKLLELKMQKNLGKDVQKDIDDLETTISKTNQYYNDYSNLALSNPDAVKGQMYKDDVMNRYTTMFGQIKEKTQVLENPAWKAQFEMQKEANEQSRFAQTLKFNMTKEQNDNYWKQLEYEQRDRLALLSASTKKGKKGAYGGGTGPGDEVPEQGNQPSDISKIRMMEQNYENAATNFVNSSDKFIWETMGLSNPTNLALKNKLMSSGKTEDEAIHFIINKMAEGVGETPEAWRARWGDKATKAYQTMSDKEKQKNPALADAYYAYKSTRSQFDNESIVKKQVEAETRALTGDVSNKFTLTEGVPPSQFITYNGKQVKLTKDDIYDMAVYIRGYKSSIGFLNDDGARQEAKAAYKRMQLRGVSDIADNVLDLEGVVGEGTKGPITRIASLGKYAWNAAFSDASSQLGVAAVRENVNKIFKKIDTKDYEEGLRVKGEIIDRAYGIRPNLKVGIMTGDSETDKDTLYKISRWAGEYGDMNLSPDFEKFKSNLSEDPAKNTFSAQTIMDQNGNPQIEIVLYDPKDKKRLGGMTIQPDEAEKIDLDVNNLYEPREVSSLRNKINYNGGQTCAGNIKEKSTYISGDSQFDTHDFPLLQNTPFEAQANIKYSNGKYYPYIYVPGLSEARELPGLPDLQSAVLLLNQQVTPTFVKKLLIEK
jgi:hypothetical protein